MSRLSRSARLAALPIATAVLAAAPAAFADSQALTCAGGENSCTAHVPLAGGASNRDVTIALPGTNLRLRATQPLPAAVRGAFSISNRAYRLGGSEYRFVLNAVGSIGPGAYAVMTFTNPAIKAPGPRHTVTCQGTEQVCTALVSLRGGAGNFRVTVRLPGTNLKLVQRSVTPASAKGSWSLRGGRYMTGGSVYTATLNAVRSLGGGAWLYLTFRAPLA